MLTQAYLKSILHYNPETGVFTWINSPRRGWNGKRAGYLFRVKKSRTMYWRVRILKSEYLLHRLAFLYMTGSIPDMIDHRDLDGLNNKFANLRECTYEQNLQNVSTPSTNTSGKKNVYFRPDLTNPWRGIIRANGKVICVGNFPTIELAAEAVRLKRIELHGEFANHD